MLSLTDLTVGGTSGVEGRGGPHSGLAGGDPGHASERSGHRHFKTNCWQAEAGLCLQMLVGW